MKNQAIKKKSLLKRPFKAKMDGVFFLVIFVFLPKIFKFLLICKLGTDDITRCACERQNRISSKSLERMNSAMETSHGHLTPYNTQHGA